MTVRDLFERLFSLPDYAQNMRVTIVDADGDVITYDLFGSDVARLDFTFTNDEDRAEFERLGGVS